MGRGGKRPGAGRPKGGRPRLLAPRPVSFGAAAGLIAARLDDIVTELRRLRAELHPTPGPAAESKG